MIQPRFWCMASYHGHGLAIGSLKIHDNSDVQLLQEENQRLQAELQYLHELLSIWQPPTCSICQLHSNNAQSSTKGTRSRASTTAKDSTSTYAAVDRVLRQQQVLIAQQQRQLLVLQAELSSRQHVVLEAEALLAETHRKITALGTWASQHTQQQGAAQPTGLQSRPTTASSSSSSVAAAGSGGSRRLVPSSSLGSRTGTPGSFRTPSAGAAGTGAAAAAAVPGGLRGATAAAAAGNSQQVCAVVVDHCRPLLSWCRESDARLARAKAASAAQCRCLSQPGSSSSSQSGHKQRGTSSSGTGSSKPQWQSPDKAAAAAAAAAVTEGAGEGLQLQYIPAGGNTFLQPGSELTLPDIAAGLGTSALAAPALQQLMHLLATLAAPLAAFAVQLRSIILPALPWIQASELATDLPSNCAQLAQQSATAAVKLAELCAVLPAAPGVLSAPAAHVARRLTSQQAAAAADAGAWGAPQQKYAAAGAAAGAGDRTMHANDSTAAAAAAYDAEDSELLQDLANVLSHYEGKALGGKGTKSQLRPSLSGKSAAPMQVAKRTTSAKGQASAGALLERLQARFQVLQLKQCVLNDQLGFLAKCSAAQAKLMARLATDVLQAVRDALGAADPPNLQQQRSRAGHLCSQLQRACLLIQQQQQQPGGSAGRAAAVFDEGIGAATGSSALFASSSFSSRSGAGSSTARTVLALLEDNWELLDAMPKLLAGAGKSALESAATAAVVKCLNDFRAALQP